MSLGLLSMELETSLTKSLIMVMMTNSWPTCLSDGLVLKKLSCAVEAVSGIYNLRFYAFKVTLGADWLILPSSGNQNKADKFEFLP